MNDKRLTEDPRIKGDLAELKVIEWCLQKGYTPLTPFGGANNCRYDVAYDDGQSIKRVQVKCRSLYDDKLSNDPTRKKFIKRDGYEVWECKDFKTFYMTIRKQALPLDEKKNRDLQGVMQNVYLVSEGNGGQNMKYVPENQILTLLNG